MIRQIYTGFSLLTSSLVYSYKIRTAAIKASFNENDEILEPPYNISVVIPSYNEETLVEYALSSIRNQNVLKKYPDKFELVLVDSNSTDNTVNIAKNYVDKIVNISQRGKLTARNLSLPYLNGTIIVSVDADSFYPSNWLNLMLKPFNDKNVVAESGFTLDELPQYGWLINKLHPLISHIANCTIHEYRMYGRNCAYYKDLHQLELFNENINQLNVNEMLKEEELDWGKRLSKYGKFIYNNRACCLHLGNMKYNCRYGFSVTDEIDKLYCEEFRKGERF